MDVRKVMAAMALFMATGAFAAERTEADDPAAFLGQLAGEWSVEAEAVPGPGMEPIRTRARMVARLVDGRWLVAESVRTVREKPVTSIRTLGYDPAGKRFVGAWIDGMQSHLWLHAGTRDADGTSLTLETEGPVLGDAAHTTRYREIIEIDGPDRYVIRSLILGPGGEWFEFGKADHRRAR